MTVQDFTKLILPIKDKLYRFSLRLVNNVTEAEDVVQEVLMKMWQKKEMLHEIKNVEAWSIQLTKNLSIDKLRSKHRKVEPLKGNNQLSIEQVTPQNLAERKDLMEQIHQYIQTLPEKQKMVIQLREIEGMSYEEIADILDMPINQVKVNLFRARKSLKQALLKISKQELYG